jgi:hypothetical protein
VKSEEAPARGTAGSILGTAESRFIGSEAATEHVQCRNHDHECGYDVQVVIRRADTTAFDERLYLQPGGVRSLSDVVPSGTWQVVVSLDGGSPRTAICSIGPSLDQTVVVECGNGALSVTDRQRSRPDDHRQ